MFERQEVEWSKGTYRYSVRYISRKEYFPLVQQCINEFTGRLLNQGEIPFCLKNGQIGRDQLSASHQKLPPGNPQQRATATF